MRGRTVEVLLFVFRRLISLVVMSAVALAGGTVSCVPAAAAAAAATPAAAYVVKAGDTLTGIAERKAVSFLGLLRVNQLSVTSVIRPGQVLILPPRVTAPVVMPGVLPADLRTPAKQALLPMFRKAAKDAGVPADLLMSLSYTESSWQQSARSPDKAIGLGQLLPVTAKWIASDLIGDPRLDARKAEDNVRMTAVFLRYLLRKFPTSTEQALSAYFEGEFLVRTKGPSNAGKQYARKILNGRVMFSRVM